MRSILEIHPTSNYDLASERERADAMHAFSRVLMGLSAPIQLIARARSVIETYDWPRPPTLKRSWLAVLEDADPTVENSPMAMLRGALEGIGLHCELRPPPYGESDVPVRISRGNVELDPNGEVAATLVLRRWPREVAPGWLGLALSGTTPVDVAIHVAPQDADAVARQLRTQQTRQAGSDEAADQLGEQDAETVRKSMIAHTDQPVSVAIAMTVRAPTRESLKQRIAAVQHACRLTLADVREATFEHDRGLMATLPTGECNLLSAWHGLDCTSVASTWPFQPCTVDHAKGAPLGVTHTGGMLVRLDPFDPSLESFGGIILGKVGSGKSYFLKLLCRRLENVEVLIVEQRNPAEYANVPGATTLNLANIEYANRAEALRVYVSRLWETAKDDPRPRLLILDELWSLLRDPKLAALVEEIARIGRHHYLSLFISTQQIQEMLTSEQGLAVLNNAAVKVYLKQNGPDGELLASKAGLSRPAYQFLRGAGRGQALLDVSSMLVPVVIQASTAEHQLVTTDPREKIPARL